MYIAFVSIHTTTTTTPPQLYVTTASFWVCLPVLDTAWVWTPSSQSPPPYVRRPVPAAPLPPIVIVHTSLTSSHRPHHAQAPRDG
jgi:hypothetical protein